MPALPELHITAEIPNQNRDLVNQRILFSDKTGHHFGVVKEALADDWLRVEGTYWIKCDQIVDRQ